MKDEYQAYVDFLKDGGNASEIWELEVYFLGQTVDPNEPDDEL